LADHFCINTLSEYYLDVRKDVLYCDPPNAPRRRSTQTALWHISRTLARALAPLLSFTAEETWQTLAEQGLLNKDEKPESVFLNSFPEEIPLPVGKYFVMGDFLRAKRAVNEAVEKARQAGTVKSSNDAAVRIKIHEGNTPLNVLPPEELASLLGVASVDVELTGTGDPVYVMSVSAASGAKCSRCWIWRDLDNGLCARCRDAETAAPAKP